MPGPGPRGKTALTRGRGLLCWPRGFRVWWRFLQAGAVPGHGTLDGFGKVVPQVPPVGDLDGQRGTLCRAFGVAAAAVPADDLHPRVRVQPGAEGFRRPLRQHVHRPARVDVDQDGAVDVPLAQREIIHPQHQRGPVIRVGGGADEPHQRRPAHRAGQPAGQPGTGPAAQGQRDRQQHSLQAAGAPPMTRGQARYLLRERGLGAPGVAAEESPDLQVNEHFPAAARGIGQLPLVAAVHPPRHRAAPRAGCLASAGPGHHMHRPAHCGHALDGHVGQMRNQNDKSLRIARPP
jgi:hypothetical protein